MCGALSLEPYVSLFPEHPGTHPKLPPPLPLRNARNTSCYPSHRCLSLLERWVSHLPCRVEQEGSDLVEGGWKCGFGVHRARSGTIWTSPQWRGNKKVPACVRCWNILGKGGNSSNAPIVCLTCGKGLFRKHWMEFPPHKAYYEANGIKWKDGCDA